MNNEKLTANTITNEQIRELRDTAHLYGDGDPDFVERVCARALDETTIDGVADAERTLRLPDPDGRLYDTAEWRHARYIVDEHEARVTRARARCAEILNSRNSKESK